MNLKGKIFATAAAAVLAVGLGGGVSAQDLDKGLTVDVALNVDLGILDYYFVASGTPVDFLTAEITALSGDTKTGSATVYLVDARLAPANIGFELTVNVNLPFDSGTNNFAASAAELVEANDPVLTTTVTYPEDGDLIGVAASTESGSLASLGQQILTGANASNVQLNQVLDLEVNVPANTPLGTYTTTLILTGVDSATP